jgi:hypothetical protein
MCIEQTGRCGVLYLLCMQAAETLQSGGTELLEGSLFMSMKQNGTKVQKKQKE